MSRTFKEEGDAHWTTEFYGALLSIYYSVRLRDIVSFTATSAIMCSKHIGKRCGITSGQIRRKE